MDGRGGCFGSFFFKKIVSQIPRMYAYEPLASLKEPWLNLIREFQLSDCVTFDPRIVAEGNTALGRREMRCAVVLLLTNST